MSIFSEKALRAATAGISFSAMLLLTWHAASAQDHRSGPPVLGVIPKVVLACKNSGSHQDVSKEPRAAAQLPPPVAT